MRELIFDESGLFPFAGDDFRKMKPEAMLAYRKILERYGTAAELLGWVDLPVNHDRAEYARVKEAAARIREQSDLLICIGIGGSYLGAKAAVEFIHPTFGFSRRHLPEIIFAGNNLSSVYLNELIAAVRERDFSVNVISKSGTTTEPQVAFRFFRKLLEEKYGRAEAARRVYVTTDAEKGTLRRLAGEEGYTCFVIPESIGGRYSVLTPVGLLPMAVAGLDLDALFTGASDERAAGLMPSFEKNQALRYAAWRSYLYRNGKKIEVLSNFEPSLRFVAEWWKQLFGESEGKDGQGIFPATVSFTTDLHSMGQYLQQGERHLFETVLAIEEDKQPIHIPEVPGDPDGLGYLAGRPLSFVNRSARLAAARAHIEGGVPTGVITLPKRDEYSLGHLFYFFEYACAVSGYIGGINPFDQPGEALYRKYMLELLHKPEG